MTDRPTEVGWRVKAGFAVFVASLAWPVLLPILPLLGASGGTVAAFGAIMASYYRSKAAPLELPPWEDCPVA